MTKQEALFKAREARAKVLEELTYCKYCGKELKKKSVGAHVGWCNENPNKRTDKPKSFLGKTHTDEAKKRISESRKKYLEKNKHKHNWSLYRNKESDPEKKFREIIEKCDIVFYQYYIPNDINRNFEIDFAIPELKIGFEINGNQHYDDNELSKYYKERHLILEDAGWNIIEIHYSICYDEEKLKEIIVEVLNGNIKFVKEKCNEVLKFKIENKRKKLIENIISKINRYHDRINLNENRYEIITETLKEFGDKNGIIGILSDKLGVSHTHVRRILKSLDIKVKVRSGIRST